MHVTRENYKEFQEVLVETVRIDKYDEKWPLMFQEEKRKVEEIMAEKAIAFEHIGSTAVPGL
jgi:GrpB-like predicted nucleotidyltransferase (UPF0157 family)